MITQETITSALVTDWNTITKQNTAPGIQRQMVVGKNMMVCRFTFDPFLVTPEHTHPHEQITLVAQGKVKFIIDGEVKIVSAGDVLYFPSNNRHGATMLDEDVILIDIFSPVREDFLTPPSENGSAG